MRARLVRAVLCLLLVPILPACLDRELSPLNPCLTTTLATTVHVENIDKVDLLFVVDDSGSMRDEQTALRREFPKLIRTLTSGVREDGSTFAPVRDLHLGVVSTDIGAGGQPVLPETGCGDPGGDGVLRNELNPGMDPMLADICPATGDARPSFLSFVPERDDPDEIARQFQCIATLGTEGCGFEQQLEAMLKAVTPSVLPGTSPGDPQPRFWRGDGTLVPGNADGPNAGFVRSGQGPDRSLLAIVVVTDEEDCSASDTRVFDMTDGERRNELRCFLHRDKLYDIRDRYVSTLRAIRPEEKLLIFGAIVGVPQDLVSERARSQVNWESPASIEQYYDAILRDDRMQQRINSEGDKLESSCTNESGPEPQFAYPPRRIVELASAFGKNGVVQSICEDNFGPAMDVLIEAIVQNLGNVCLPRTLVPNDRGLVEGCEVVWELPETPWPGSIGSCGERSYLTPRTAVDGSPQCAVDQVAVRGGAPEPGRAGWYYDDFSAELGELCSATPQRIAFTEPPPSGVTVRLDCAKDFAAAPEPIDLLASIEQPTVGSDCRGQDGSADDSRCVVTLGDGQREQRMLCHPTENVCIQPCVADGDCPGAFRCDDRPETIASAGRAICVNPTCGEQ